MMRETEVFYTDDFMFDVMGIEKLPGALYQYTSIDSLEKIITTRSVRFSRLDTVNDSEEAAASDVPFAASSVFVSCWSVDEREHIPMWSMYGRSFAGVRLRLPSNMFTGRRRAMVFEKGGAHSTFEGKYEILRQAPASHTTGRSIVGPNKIWYSDDADYRNRRLVHRRGNAAHFFPYDLGMVKNTNWTYEQEWRFKISALPFEAQFPNDAYFNEVTIDFAAYPVLTPALFIPIDPSSLDEAEIMIGSKVDADGRRRVERLIAEHAPNADFAVSKLAIR